MEGKARVKEIEFCGLYCDGNGIFLLFLKQVLIFGYLITLVFVSRSLADPESWFRKRLPLL